MTLVLQGDFVERFGRERRVLSRFDTVFKPSEVDHANEFPHGARCFVLEFDELTAWLEPAWQGRPRTDVWFGSGAVSARMSSLCMQSFAEDPDPLAVEEGVAMVVTELAARTRCEPSVSDAGWLELVRERVLDDPRSPPSLGELASSAGVHPAHLCRSFRSRYGMTIGQYARRLRIDRGVQLVVGTTAPLATVATRLGYYDQAHFTRDFRRFTGTTPGRLRRSHR